jgi:hypothetical protein
MTFNRSVTLATCVFVWLLAGATGDASTFAKTTYLTFNRAVALPGVTLPAGEYLFELANPHTARNVVRVMDRERSKVYLTALTRFTPRPGGLRDGLVTLGEARSGFPVPITAWFPQDEIVGYAFIY